MTAVDPDEVRQRLDRTADELRIRAARLRRLRADLAASAPVWRRAAQQRSEQLALEVRRAARRNRTAVDANAGEAEDAARELLGRLLTEFAPGLLSAGWDDPRWERAGDAHQGEWVRVGAFGEGDERRPVVVPLSAGVWRVHADAGGFRDLVHGILLRCAAAFGPFALEVGAFDPALELDLSAFAELRVAAPRSVPAAATSEEEFEEVLRGLRVHASEVDDRLGTSGLQDVWSPAASGLVHRIGLRVAVLAQPLGAADDRATRLLDQVRRLAAPRGVLVVERVADGVPSGGPGIDIRLDGAGSTLDSDPDLRWTPDARPAPAAVRRISASIARSFRKPEPPTIPFAAIVDAVEDPWLVDADEGLEAVIGSTDGRPLAVRLRSENPPMPNALIGGAVGQGKSNLLLVLIHSLAATYSPAELEMVLVDLRDGVEFARLAPTPNDPTWLPHVRALGLEFDPDFSIGVLRWLRDRMTARSAEMKAASATTLKEFSARTGRTLPRILVVVDEFQRLFEGDDEQVAEAAALLEGIARTGRGFGVHLVLASQAISGIRGLAAKQDAIFGQFHNRITLRNTAGESQLFLSPQNTAAARLTHRGEVLVNDALGVEQANVVGTAAFADPDFLRRLKADLHRRGHGGPPSVFRASVFADAVLPRPDPAGAGVLPVIVGMPIAVEPEPRTVRLTTGPNQVLAVVGADAEVARAVMTTAVVSAALALPARSRIEVLDAESSPDGVEPWIAALIEQVRRLGHEVLRSPREDVALRIVELSRGGGTDLVVPVALDALELTEPVGESFDTADEALRALGRTGSTRGTRVIGWWRSLSVLRDQLGYDSPAVRAWALCGVGAEDLAAVCGRSVLPPTASPRFVWFDRSASAGPERLVPIAARTAVPVDD